MFGVEKSPMLYKLCTIKKLRCYKESPPNFQLLISKVIFLGFLTITSKVRNIVLKSTILLKRAFKYICITHEMVVLLILK